MAAHLPTRRCLNFRIVVEVSIFVGAEDGVRDLAGVARDLLDLAAHAEQQGVEGVAAGGEQGAAAAILRLVFQRNWPYHGPMPW